MSCCNVRVKARTIKLCAKKTIRAINVCIFSGADETNRTSDLLITNQLLYRLSYISEGAYFNKEPGFAARVCICCQKSYAKTARAKQKPPPA